MKWLGMFGGSAAQESIKVSALRKLPQLKICPHWDRVTFLGWVSYRLPFANYDGGVVRYADRIYYLNRSQIEALRSFVHWDLRKQITVVNDLSSARGG